LIDVKNAVDVYFYCCLFSTDDDAAMISSMFRYAAGAHAARARRAAGSSGR